MAKESAQYWLTAYRGLSLPSKSWLGKLTALHMTPLDWLGRKTSTQTNKEIFMWYPLIWSYEPSLSAYALMILCSQNLAQL